jgi:hypothetical protein
MFEDTTELLSLYEAIDKIKKTGLVLMVSTMFAIIKQKQSKK